MIELVPSKALVPTRILLNDAELQSGSQHWQTGIGGLDAANLILRARQFNTSIDPGTLGDVMGYISLRFMVLPY